MYPNCIQFGLGFVLSIWKYPRCMVHIAAGFGKSRIMVMAGVVFLKVKIGKVYFVIPNAYLVERDKKAFESVWKFADPEDSRVSYHTKLDF